MIMPEWHQTAPWNRYCPGQGQNRAHAGSHALAMAKTMKYWAYPYSGTGSVSYVDDDFGTINYNFDSVINWGGMSNTQVFATTQRFIAACGAAALTDYEMDYSNSSLLNVRTALIQYFSYDDLMNIASRSSYSLSAWENVIRHEIDNQRPVIYSVTRSDGTELAFIIDAYNEEGLFHANFSDNENPNAWLDLGALEISGESFDPEQQDMLHGIQPSLGPDTISENFEDGFGNHNWQFAGNANWTISTEAAFFGSHSAKSGNIDHNQSTSLYIVIDVTEESTISFYKMVSCEGQAQHEYDHLRFEIDGIEMERWSGNGQWGFHEYPVSPGIHSFRWTYAKDGATTSYNDCAWVDAITFPPGTTPLMPPRDLNASLSGSRNVSLSWLPPLVTEGLLGYKIFRNGNQIAQYSNPQQISFTDYDLPNGDYSYHLQAVYTTGLSLPGNSAEVSVEVPYAPVNLVASPASYSSLMLTWQAPPLLRNRALLGYSIYESNLLIATINDPATLSYHHTGLEQGIYYYNVTARYSQAESAFSNTATGVLGVAQPPSSLQATVYGNDVSLHWSQVPDLQNLIGFKLFRDGVQIAYIHNPISYDYLDENLPNGNYAYFVRAIYLDVESGNSVTAYASIEVPYPPTNLVAMMIDNDVQLNWQRPPLIRALTHYYIYRNGQVIGAVFNPNITSYTDHDLPPGIYSYYVTAFYSGVESPPSNTASTGSEPLWPPQNFSYSLTNNDVQLTWLPPVIYDRDLTGYRIWRNESVIADNYLYNEYLDQDLPNGTYFYKVAAIYEEGISEPTPTLTVNVTYAQAPVNLQASLNDPDVHLTWQAAPTGPTPDNYRVYRNGAMILELSQNTYTDRVPDSGYYTYYVTAMFGSYESEPSNSVTEYVSYAAQTPVISGQTLGNTVVLNIDRGFVPEDYEFAFTTIFRNGAFLADITEDFYIDSDLPNGNYQYFCYAVYGSENPHVTLESNIYSTTIDQVYPPSNLTGSQDGTTIQLSWEGVYSPLRPITYKVYRNGVVVTQTAETSFTDPDLPGGNYNYYVTAMFGTQESGSTNSVNFFVEELLPPTNLTGNVIGRSVHLAWFAPETPTRELNGYSIWRNGSQIVELTSQTSYVDSDLANGDYQYQVAAIYSTGVSELTAPLALNVSYTPAPHNLSGSVINLRVVNLNWNGASDVDADYYRIYRDNEYIGDASWETAEDTPSASGSYSYHVTAVYGTLESTPSNSINLEVNLDPTTIQLFGEALGNDVELSWNILNAPPSGELIHYEIYRNSALLAESMTPIYTDNDLPNAYYEYTVRAIYNWYGTYTTAMSNSVVTTIDLPYPPEGLQYSVDQNNVSLTWQPVSSLQSPVSYRVYRNGVALSQNDVAEYHDLGLANGSYSYYVTTLFGNEESLPSESVALTIEIPYPPQELSAQVVEDSVILNWNAPATGPDRSLSGYYIYRNGNLLQSLADPSQLSYTDNGVPNGEYSYYLRAIYGTMLSDASNTVTVVVDVAPDLFPPTNLSATIIGERDVELSWNAPEGNPEMYLIYRNGNQIGTSISTTYLDSNLSNGAYQYYVRAQYPEGISAPGNSVPVNIMYAYPPAGLMAEVQNQTDISLSWNAPNQGETAYLLFVNNVETAFIADPATTSYLLDDLPNGMYHIYLKAVYPSAISLPGNTVNVSIEVLYSPGGFALQALGRNVNISWNALENLYGFQHYVLYRNSEIYQQLTTPGFLDANLPNGLYTYSLGAVYSFGATELSQAEPINIQVTEAPQNLQASATDNSVTLTWDAASDTGYLETYKLYQNGELISSSAQSPYTVNELPNGEHSFYLVAAYSFADSQPSNTATAIIEVAYPAANLSAQTLESTVNLSWNAPPAYALAYQFLGYRVYRDGALLAEIPTLGYSDTDLENGDYLYEVTALYAFGESLPISAEANVFITYPPTNLAFTYSPPNGIALNWNSPQMGETGFRVYRNESLIAELTGYINTYNDDDLPNGEYTYRVTSLFGTVESASSNDVLARIVVAYAPYGLSLQQTSEHILLSWNIADSGLLSQYLVYRNDVEIGNTTEEQFTAPIPPNGNYTYHVIAVYEDNLQSSPSNTADIQIQVSYPVILSGSYAGDSVSLNWTDTPDTGGFTGYRLYCNGDLLYSGTNTNFTHENLTNNPYSYHVVTAYQWGDSAPSNTYDAVIQVPHAPENLTGTLTGNNVTLSWQAPSDAGGLLYYRLYRGSTEIHQGNALSYEDNDLPNGDYSYAVKAVYALSGESSPSNAFDALVQVTYPPQNTIHNVSGNTVTISWEDPADLTYFQYFRVYRDGSLIESTSNNSFVDEAMPNGIYNYTITSVYSFGESLPTPVPAISIQVAYPAQALQVSLDETDASLQWEAPIDVGFFVNYKIFRNGELLAETTDQDYEDQDLLPGAFEYWIVSAYTFGDSPASNSVQVEIADFQVPQNVLAISIDSSVQVVWEPVQPATHFIHYKVYRDNQEIGTSTHVVFVDEDRPNGSYSYQVSSLYSQGESELSAVSALDHIKAYPPLDMFIEIQRNIATVSWYTPVDTGFLSGFRIYRNGEAIYDMPYNRSNRMLHSFADTDLAPGSYSYTVASIYGDIMSPEVTPTNPDEATIQIDWPHVPQNLSANALDESIQLQWEPVPDAVEFLHYIVYMNSALMGTTTSTTYMLEDLPNGSYSFQVSAQYQLIESAQSDACIVEHILPRLPENFAATVVDGYNVRLNWQIPQDSYGFSSFILKRNNVEIYTGTDATFLDQSLPNGNYRYDLQSVYGSHTSSQVVTNIRIAQVAGATGVIATKIEEGFQISFNAPDLPFTPDYYEVHFIPDYPNSPAAEWVFVERVNSPGIVLDTVHGGMEYGNFTWAVVCGWTGIPETGIAYTNSIFVEKIPEYNYLTGNFPNPFNPTTNIVFWLKDDSPVTLKIYNLRGQLVRTLFRGDLPKGTHSVVFDGKNSSGNTLPSGTYIYHMQAKGYSRSRKMTLSK